MDDLSAKFGARLRQERKAQKITLDCLSERVGISPNFLGDIERGKKSPSFDCLIKILSALNVSADALLYDSISSNNVAAAKLARQLDELSPVQRDAAINIIENLIQNLKTL